MIAAIAIATGGSQERDDGPLIPTGTYVIDKERTKGLLVGAAIDAIPNKEIRDTVREGVRISPVGVSEELRAKASQQIDDLSAYLILDRNDRYSLRVSRSGEVRDEAGTYKVADGDLRLLPDGLGVAKVALWLGDALELDVRDLIPEGALLRELPRVPLRLTPRA